MVLHLREVLSASPYLGDPSVFAGALLILAGHLAGISGGGEVVVEHLARLGHVGGANGHSLRDTLNHMRHANESEPAVPIPEPPLVNGALTTGEVLYTRVWSILAPMVNNELKALDAFCVLIVKVCLTLGVPVPILLDRLSVAAYEMGAHPEAKGA